MSLVETKIDAHLGWLILNRPDKLNAFNAALLEQFSAALEQLQETSDVRCIIIRGAGRAFSVGYDINEEAGDGSTAKRAADDWLHLRKNIDRWISVWRCPKPVIAAIHGYCMGGATQLAVCCDLTVVAADAVIGWPSLPLGGGLLSPVSAWLIGPKKAKELSYIAGSRLTGEEAATWGWANYATEPGNVTAMAESLARKIVKTPPDLLRIKKQALNRIMDIQGFSEAAFFGAEFDAIAHTAAGYDAIRQTIAEEGLKGAIASFRETP